jgi:hypothetical protein
MAYPQITKAQTSAFAKAWDRGGIKLLLDDSSVQFATDWANIVLKSYVDEAAKAGKKQQVNQPQQPPTPPAPPTPKSSIILTDM